MTDPGGFENVAAPTAAPALDIWEVTPDPTWENRETRRRRKSLAVAAVLFALTLISTLAVGAQYAVSYAAGQSPDFDALFSMYPAIVLHPQLLLAGAPFAFTLIGILLA